MKAKRIMAFLMALTLTVALSACGNINTAQEIMANNVETKESEEIKSEETEEEETETTEAEDDKAIDEVDEDEAVDEVDEDEAVDEADESEESESVETVEPAETVEPKTDKTETAKTETSAPVQTTAPKQNSEPSAPAQTEKPAATPAPTATPTPEPVHQHSWKEHVATTQVWVPNIVVVDDYEEQTTKYCLYICNCDYETTDMQNMKDHAKSMILANEPGHSNFTVQEHHHTEQVKVGSHEEDHGYYETSNYVDYYYCDCGERK